MREVWIDNFTDFLLQFYTHLPKYPGLHSRKTRSNDFVDTLILFSCRRLSVLFFEQLGSSYRTFFSTPCLFFACFSFAAPLSLLSTNKRLAFQQNPAYFASMHHITQITFFGILRRSFAPVTFYSVNLIIYFLLKFILIQFVYVSFFLFSCFEPAYII